MVDEVVIWVKFFFLIDWIKNLKIGLFIIFSGCILLLIIIVGCIIIIN